MMPFLRRKKRNFGNEEFEIMMNNTQSVLRNTNLLEE